MNRNELREQRDHLQYLRELIWDSAVDQYVKEGEIEIDDNTIISVGDSGAYVQAWVYVDEADVKLPDEYENKEEDYWEWITDCANPVTPQELQDALSGLLKAFKTCYGADFHNNPEAKAAAVLLARMKGSDPIEDPDCYLRDDL